MTRDSQAPVRLPTFRSVPWVAALRRRGAALLTCGWLLSGCATPNAQYQPYPAHMHEDGYDLSFVEFDEMGDFWDRRQLDESIRAIAARQEPALLLIYIHGWQNNAADDSHDVGQFRCILTQLAESRSAQTLRVHGVYLGWRGLAVKRARNRFSNALLLAPRYLSFWSRKEAATRVAGTPVTETIFRLIRQTRAANPYSRCVLVGHSFGALVLEKAMAQAMIGALFSQGIRGNPAPPDAPVELYTPADLVLLINSAGESIYAKEMIDLFRSFRVSSDDPGGVDPEHPLVISLTSEGDWATGKIFPLGTTVSNLFGLFRRYEQTREIDGADRVVDQRKYFTKTPGHNPLIRSHVIVPQDSYTAERQHQAAPIMIGCDTSENPAFEENLQGGPSMDFVTVDSEDRLRWRIEPDESAGAPTPYWIVQVPRRIIRSHFGIFDANARAMMAALFRVTSMTTPRSEPRTMQLSLPAMGGP